MSEFIEEQPSTQPDSQLVKFSESAAAVAAMKEKCKGLTVDGVKDHKGLAKVRESRLEVKRTRVDLEKYADSIKAPALKFLRTVNEQLNPLVYEMEQIEKPLYQIEKDIEKEKKRLEEERIQKRVDQLGQYAAPFDFSIVKKMSEKDFKKFLAEAKSTFEREQYEKQVAEQKLKLEQEELARQQEELLAQQQQKEEVTPIITEVVEVMESQTFAPIPEDQLPPKYFVEVGSVETAVFDATKIDERISLLKRDYAKINDLTRWLDAILYPSLEDAHHNEVLFEAVRHITHIKLIFQDLIK